MTPFTISCNDIQRNDCLYGIIVQKGNQEGEYDTRLLNGSSDKQQKHLLHSLSQIALYQFEDQEIDVQPLHGSCLITGHSFADMIDEGLVLIQGQNNTIELFAHQTINVKKALDSAYRYCTRWIRLDI